MWAKCALALRMGTWASTPYQLTESFPPRSHVSKLPLPACQGSLVAKCQGIAGHLHPMPQGRGNLEASPILGAKPALLEWSSLSEEQLSLVYPVSTSCVDAFTTTVPVLSPSEQWDLVLRLVLLLPCIWEPRARGPSWRLLSTSTLTSSLLPTSACGKRLHPLTLKANLMLSLEAHLPEVSLAVSALTLSVCSQSINTGRILLNHSQERQGGVRLQAQNSSGTESLTCCTLGKKKEQGGRGQSPLTWSSGQRDCSQIGGWVLAGEGAGDRLLGLEGHWCGLGLGPSSSSDSFVSQRQYESHTSWELRAQTPIGMTG